MAKSKNNNFASILLPTGLGFILFALAFAGCKQSPPVSEAPANSKTQSQSPDLASDSGEPAAPGTDWTQFRGPGATSTAFTTGFPTSFDQGNVVWKSELIGRGASTPIIVGDKVFLTSYTGYGESAENPGSLSKLRHHLFCFNRTDGTLIWQRDIQGSLANEEKLNPNLLGHGFASSTPVTDGKSIFAFFGTSGVFAYDVEGNSFGKLMSAGATRILARVLHWCSIRIC